MSLFKKRCMYCMEKIEKGHERFVNVEVPGYVETLNKPFCSEEHTNKYEEEVRNLPKKSRGGCCG